MRNLNILRNRGARRDYVARRRMSLLGIVTILSLLVSLFPQVVGQPMPTAEAHNLNASAVYAYFDANTQAYLDGLIATNQRPAGTPLLQPGDELGIIIKAVPDEGTTTGVGGYTTFYVPNGVQVVDAAYIMPGDLIADGITGFDKVPMKGQAQMPIVGAGGDPTVSLVGITRGPNILGVTSPIVTAANTNLGTVVGVYGDTGIFYSTAPETAFGTYTGGSITNNSGDTVGLRTVLGTTLNKWDAWQMAGYGIKGTTNPAYPAAALIDSNQRGYAPWGLANVVAGPQSGYAWEFDFAKYTACDPSPTATPTSACIDQATQDIGPWQRIKYPGSQFSDDPPGGTPSLPQPYTRGADASNSGFDLTTGDLPQTTDQANGTPVAVRWAYGQQTQNRPEYMWIKIKVHDNTAILDPTGCPKWTVDTFGGDAGGDSGGKDHIWRYYDPNSVTFNGCLAIGKPATRELVKVGDNYQYKVKLYNSGGNDFSTVQIQDTLPSGVTYISAVPAPSSVSLPNLTWTVAPFLRSQMFEATVTVKASGSGLLTNNVCATGITTPGGQTVTSCGKDTTVSGPQPLLRQNKTVSPATAAPGSTVGYTIGVLNVGSGPTGSPVVLTEYLPAGFTYVGTIPGTVSAVVNGASVTASVSGTAAQPIFTVPSVINAGQALALSFNASVSASITAGNYCNSYRISEGGINQVTGALACVDVGGGSIGDTVYRDWNGSGAQDPGEEGLPGVTVTLNTGACPGGAPTQTATTDANGFYQFTGLAANTYCVDPAGPAGYTLTQGTDPTQVTLAQSEKRLNVDFGYQPAGAGSIGDLVFDDKGNDGTFNGADVGIPGVTVNLYEDTNGNGLIDTGDVVIATDVTDGSGIYGFSGLAEGLSYIVDVDQADPDLNTYFGGAYVLSTADPQPVPNLVGAYLRADFGFYEVVPGSIGDLVWLDADGDGAFDAGEAGLANVTVRLYQDANGNGVVDTGEALLAQTTTDAAGNYSFINLPAGAYVVDVDENDSDIPSSLSPSRDPIAVTLSVAQNKIDVDFPFVQSLSKTVDKTTAAAGEQVTYTLYPRYFGDNLLAGLVVNDPIPTGTTYLAASIDPGAPAGEAVDDTEPVDTVIDRVAWDLGSNAPGLPGYSGGTAMCPATQTIVAGKDTHLDSNDINANYGSEATISVDSDKVFDGLVQFTLPTLPVGAVLDKAELLLTVKSGQNAARTVAIHKLLKGPWTEGASNNTCTTGAAWQGPNCTDDWLSAGGNFGSSDYGPQLGATIAPATSGATYATVVTSAVNDWYTTPSANYGLVLLATGSDNGEVKFNSRTGDAGSEPKLVLTYRVPTAGGCSGTVNLTDIADTYIQEDSGGNDNFGDATEMKVRPESTKHKHALLKFDINGVPVGATVTAATLKVNVRTAKANVASEIHRLTTDWVEGTDATNGAQWNDPNGTGTAGTWASGAFSAGDYNASVIGAIAPTSTGVKTTDVKSLVEGWNNNTFPNYGLLLLSIGTSTADASYRSREDGTAANRPVIVVSWSIPPANPTRVNTISASPNLVVEGDVVTVKMVLQNLTGTPVANASPSALSVTGDYSCATLSGPSPASQAVPANGAATFTWTCTTNTAPTQPGDIIFSATASGDGGATTWASSTSETIRVTPPLTFKVTVNNPIVVSQATNQAEAALSFPATLGQVCYVMADGFDTNDVDYLRQVDRTTGVVTPASPTAAGTQSIEAMTWSPDFNTLYAVNANQLGTLNVTTGAFTAKPNTIASVALPLRGEFGNITVADVDGISFDPATGALFGVHRREATNTQLDVLIKIDPTTGRAIQNAFGAGVDYIKIRTDLLATPLYEVDDISFDPVSGQMFAIANGTAASPSVSDRLVTINKSTGAVTDIARVTKSTGGNLDDVEGLSFYGDGGLYATSGYHAATGDTNKLWDLDKNTAVATEVAVLGTQTTYNDYEAVACRGGSLNTGVVPSNEVHTGFTASIGDRVWSDVDGDGVQDAGEPGLAGVEVCATPTGGGAAVCDTTDVNGAYRIYGLTNGATYNAALTPGTIPIGYAPTFTPTQPRTATTAGESNTDFGLRPPGTASIGDYVWLDADNDGVQDPTESGLPNITVKLYIDQNNNGSIDGGDTLLQTTTTDANGLYHFLYLHPDDYLVQVDPTSPVTSPYDGATTIAAAMAPTTGTTNPRDVTISTIGQAITNADFGYNWTGSIGDTVWYDTDQDQVVDGGETRIVGATVLLYWDTDNNGVIEGPEWSAIRFMNTIAGGQYLFDNLPPGNYLVDVYEDSITADGVRDIVPTTPDVRDVDLTAGQDVDTADFGYVEGAKVEGNVFWDEDHNGVLDPAEANATHLLENVTVTIVCYGADGVPGGTDDKTLSMDTGTGGQPDGHFKFLVPPGPCTLSYETSDTNAKGYPEATTPTPVTFTAQAGEDWHPSFDFGVDNAGKVGDRVWNDANGDGIQTAGEPGISGVTVRLYAADGTTLLNTLATDTSGNYQFVGLANATYVVKVDTATLPSGYTQTGYGDPGAPCGGSCNSQGTTTVSGGNTVTTVDFGYQPPANTYPVNGRVWNDLDGNGAQNGAEPGIAGVTVCLYDSTGTNVVACTTTQATTGDYTFPGTPNGTYVIKVDPTTMPAGGFIQTGDPNGTCPGAACDNKSQVTVNNAPVTNQNFGYQQPLSSISGTVCYGNGNGDCTTGEPVAVGVPVYLTYAGADGVFGTPDDVTTPTVTDGSGNYTFPNLPGGAYQVTKTDPPGATSLADADGGNPNNISIILTPGQNKPNQDFEMLPAPVAIGDRVWLDENGNGVQDAGEDGIPNVKTQLYAANGTTLLATTYTDANGGYLFPGLQAGTYVVTVDPASLAAGLAANPTYDEDGVGTSHTTTVALTTGADHLTADFGYNWAPSGDVTGNTGTGAIGDRVWADTNGNGVQDPGEAGLGGVSVELVTAGPDGLFGTGDDVVAATTTTNAAGNYIFDGLAAGGYVVRIPTPPAGYTPTGDPDGTLDNRTTQPIVLAPGDVFVEADFGYAPQDGLPNSLGDTVWLDVDRDGVQDAGEASIPGVLVQLTWAGPDGNLATPADNVVYTTVTDDNGQYLFSDLPDGNFQVTTNLPSNTGPGGPLEGLLAASDGSGSPTDGTSDVALDPTHTTSDPVTNLAQDFGYSPNDGAGNEGLLGDTIFFDANGNGRADPGEGIPGVKVTLSGAASAVATTDANGNYTFAGLAAGTYAVTVDTSTLPGGLTNSVDPDGSNNNTAAVTLATNSSVNLNQDFGYAGAVDPLPNSLGDRVWLDADRDGVQDPGEAGIGGVLVQLTWAGPDGNLATTTDNVVYTTVTDANGGYLFTDLPDGNFNVTTNLPSNTGPGGPLEGLFAAWDGSGSLTDGTSDLALDPAHTASGPVTNLAQDFGYSPNDGTGNEGLLGDTIFFDANGNDVADPGEGIPGVKVTLDGSTVTTTDANGNYYFGGLAAGADTVVVDPATLPAGLTNTFDPDGGNDNQATVTLAANEVRLDQDLGYQAPTLQLSAIGDTVWVDANRDNTRNAGEPGIPGVSVALIRDTNGNGAWDAGELIIATDITDANGQYSFTGVPTANGVGTDDYLVWVNDTANVLAPLVATYDVRDGANQGNPTTGVVTGLTLSAVTNLDATPVTNADFAFAPLNQDAGEGLIGDTIYLDRNGNLTPDAGEGLEGVRVQLYAANGTTLLATTTTNENGQYFFGGLNPTATYVVKVDTGTLPGGLTNTVDPDGGTANQATVNLATSGPTNLNQDFGYDGANTIAGTLWQDTDADGLLDGGESGGWAGVTVALLDANNNIVATTTTDANGNYSFGNLPDGTFKVDVTDDANVLNGTWKSTGPTPGADNNSQAEPYPVTVSGGQTNSTADFGYYGTPAGLGNYAWHDLNANGIQDVGEPGLAGVEVTLTVTWPSGGGGSTVKTTTDASGYYSFGNLLLDENMDGAGAGEPTFTIAVATPAGYGPTLVDQGSNDALDSDLSGVTATTTEGTVNTSYDFGFVKQSGTIGDRVWLDENGNGVQDAGEDGIANVKVTVTKGAETQTTYTDANGGYVFDGLGVGNWTVTVDPASLAAGLAANPTYDEDGVGTSHTTTVALTTGGEHLTADFGYNWAPSGDVTGNTGTGAIGDRVWADTNGNGVQDPGEAGLGGVSVELVTAGPDGLFGTGDDVVAATTTTNAAGNYIFDGLAAGGYVVRIPTPPAGYTPTGDPDGTLDNQTTQPIVLAPGDVFVEADFGYAPQDGLPNSLGDTVWLDVDRDGVQDAGEASIPGVLVQLTWAGPDGNLATPADNVVYTTVTDDNGQYLFSDLPDGNFQVTTNLPSNTGPGGPLEGLLAASDGSGSPTDGTSDVALDPTHTTSGPVTNLAQDFGYSPNDGAGNEGLLGDTIFFDANGNGRADPGEGIPGVKVTLSGAASAVATTDANGNYTFAGLAAGTYAVTVDTSTLPGGLTNSVDPDGSNNNTAAVTLATNSSVNLNQDFGYAGAVDPLPNSLGDRVWLDADRDGVQDPGEAGIGGVLVQLTWAGPDGNLATTTDNVVYTTVTDANGGYLFTDLPDGNFNVTTNLPSNTGPGGPLEGLFAAWDGSGSLTDGTSDLALDPAHTASGPVTNLAQDFGYSPNDGTGNEGLLGDTIFFDANGNDVADPGEGIPGVKVTLDGSTVTTTDANGNYYFGGLAAGAHTVVVDPATLPAGLTNTFDPDGGNDNQATVTLAANEVRLDQDLGYQAPTLQLSAIGDTVWVDANRDNTRNAGEPGIPGVSVALIRDTNGNGAWDAGELIIATDITDANGQYSFTGVPTANGVGTDDYLVWVNDTANVLAPLVATYDVRDGANQGNPTTGVVTGLTLSAVTNLDATPVTNADFAFAPVGQDAGGGLIGDTIYLDRNGNLTPDAGEGLEGVKVQLYAANGTTLLATTTTNENGQYFFGGLNPTATYVVKVDTGTLPGGLTNTVDPDGGTASQATVNLATSGPTNLNQDFGYDGANTIAGTLWQDTDADGLLDGGESGGWAGVTVALLDANNNIVATTMTDANGNYSFGNLPDGTFKVDVTDDANVLNGTWKSTGPTPGADNNSQAEPYPVTVSGGQTNSTADFGYYGTPAGLGNYAWRDLNANGIQDVGEPGLAGVEVILTITWPSGGGGSTVKTTTDASGYYSFGNLLLDENMDGVGGAGAGEPTFTIAFATPAGYAPTLSNQGGNDALDSDLSGVTATTTEGTVNTSYDFGFVNQVPDVTPVITAVPNVMTGITHFNIFVQVTELLVVPTNGLITVRVPKDTRWVLDGPYDSTLTVLGGTPLNNPVWAYSQNATQHIFTTTATIPAGGFSTFGFKALWNAGQTQGLYTITSQIDSFSGGENRIDNNSDAEKLDYFIN